MRRSPAVLVALALILAATTPTRGGEVGFPEDFALAEDRSKALEQLIPGTEDYYFYTCLHLQNTGQLDEVDRVIEQWIKRHKRTRRVIEMENRQALLRYGTNPQATQQALQHIRQRLDLHFNHQRQLMGQKPKHPTRLAPELIDRDTLTRRALARHKGTMKGFEDRALDWAAGLDIDPDRRRHLLARLRRPDVPDLPRLVVADLDHRHSRGFGSHPIHRLLLRAQLDACLELKPALLNQTHFVHTYLTKLQPNPDEDWRHEPAVRQAYLERLWAFVARLDPAHNSLKAHVLYHRLVHDRSQGVYDKERFMTYLKLPRNVPYIEPRYMQQAENRRNRADLRADFRKVTLLPPVGLHHDEELVRSTLLHTFATEESYEPYARYINDLYLKHLFAEAKLLAGVGDMERWYSMLPPSKLQELKDRVDIDFAPTNPEIFGPDEAVALDLTVKNVKTLIVKVYAINALNYYRAHHREVNTRIELDGLVANEERTFRYDVPPLRRVKRHIEFPFLKGRGVYIVEFIGNGMSSRALIRKGRLRHLVRTSTAGHVFTVLDEANRKLQDAALWLGGHRYTPDEQGEITVPFSTSPGRQPIVLTHGDFATLDFFGHEAENYALSAGFHVEREALLTRRTAQVLLRPALTLNGTPVTLSVLEEPTLVLTSVDIEGVKTTKEVKDFALHEDRESVYEFQVPANLAKLSFTLQAKVQSLSQNKKLTLSASRQVPLNRIERTDKIQDLHLLHAGGTYTLELLGKTGEAKADRAVNFVLKHRDFRDPVHVSLQTDAQGRIALGPLEDIASVKATGPEGVEHTWHLLRSDHSTPAVLHGRAGEVLAVPYMGEAKQPTRAAFSLLETRGGTFVADRRDALALRDGFLEIRDLPAGDYDLLLKESDTRITVRLTDGPQRLGYLLSDSRHLEVRNPKPLQIASVATSDEALTIRLANASKFARVHVAAVRYVPEVPLYPSLECVPFPEPYLVTVPKARSFYVTGRDIGEEYRYILERKYAKKFPGNMLQRPTLLLNPWAIRTTETETRIARAGGRHRAVGGEGGTAAARPKAKREPSAPAREGFASLDFLSQPAAVLVNLRPDEDGVVTVQRADLGPHHDLHIVAVDPQNTAYRRLSLPERDVDFRDLRLAEGLDPQKHFTEQKEIAVVRQGEAFVLRDLATSKMETYDTLGKVYALYATLSGDPTLAEFGFLLRWPQLKPEEKRELYSKHACHELHFFLAKKDPEFFANVVRPYLAHKKDKTFLDHWLLGDDLSDTLQPWAYERLNIVERILLAQRVQGEERHTARHVHDLYELIPPNIERFNELFKTALKGRALETADEFGLQKATKEAEQRRADRAELPELAARARAAEGTALKRPAEPAATPAPPGAPPKPQAERQAGRKMDKLAEAEERDEDAPAEALARDAVGFYAEDAKKRKAVRRLYRKLEKTKEWVENNYYHQPLEEQDADLVTVNAFWNDYAAHEGDGPFFSPHLAEASGNFTEMMFALAVLDLPFEAAEHASEIGNPKFTLRPGSPMVIFYKEISEAPQAEEKLPILVSENFFRHGDRYRHVGNERYEKYVTEEFLIHTVYGAHVVLTNSTSAPQKLDLLVQIPRGAIPVQAGQQTRSIHVDLQPYHTHTLEYYFYFPGPGDFAHYPVHVAKNERLVAAAEPFSFHVVEKATKIDRTSWDYLSQNGTEDEVIAFLQDNNLGRVDLGQIAWRMRDRAFFRKVVALLAQRHVYHNVLWSYGLYHNELAAAREYLKHRDDFVSHCGAYLASRLLTIDPVERRAYQHREYWPLVNARAHPLGKTRTILNDRFHQQYMHLMHILAYCPELDDEDLMSVTTYLLIQDRVAEAQDFFARVQADRLPTRLQHDYFAAYLAMYAQDTGKARALAQRYADYPVDRWRERFAAVLAQLDEIEGKAPQVVDEEDRTEQQTRLAATEPSFDFEVEARQITLHTQNLESCQVSYYLMDIELLFSRNPFVSEHGGQFAYIRPNHTQTVALDPEQTTHTVPLPEQFHSSNVMVEITAGGMKKAQAYTANTLTLQVVENYGQVQVAHEETGKPLPKVYVKTYARFKDGRVRFYKDGYTDLRGRFDYASLNTNELALVDSFSLLVLSEDHGATVREAAPPKR